LCPSPGEEGFSQAEGVCSYPKKAKKKAPKEAAALAMVVQNGDRVLVTKRPETGLLAGLLEFPTVPLTSTESPPSAQDVRRALKTTLGVSTDRLESAGEVLHLFSHIRQTYHVWRVWLKDEEDVKGDLPSARWLNHSELAGEALPTAMKKVAAAAFKSVHKRKRERDGGVAPPLKGAKGQKSIMAYLKAKNE
jgi:A/G-specific adenine glycosylase